MARRVQWTPGTRRARFTRRGAANPTSSKLSAGNSTPEQSYPNILPPCSQSQSRLGKRCSTSFVYKIMGYEMEGTPDELSRLRPFDWHNTYNSYLTFSNLSFRVLFLLRDVDSAWEDISTQKGQAVSVLVTGRLGRSAASRTNAPW